MTFDNLASLLTDDAINTLQAQLQGTVISYNHPDYATARLAWNLAVNQHPAVIVRAATSTDIAYAVQFANTHQLKVAMQSTGHGVIVPADNSLLILTSDLHGVQVDAATQTAWIQSGAKWHMVLSQAQEHGLAPLLGSSPNVGVAGYTLGGGMGWLARQYGLALDSVLAFEIVTHSGDLIQVSEHENSDLFWALRGGGGNFGVVTAFTMKLYPVQMVVGGNLIYPADMAKEVLHHYRAWLADAPDQLTSSIVLMNMPPVPQVPEPLRGKSVVMVRGCYCGDVAEGEALLQHWLDWREPMINMFGAMPFSQVGMISNDPVDPMPGKSTGAWLHALTDEAIDTLIEYTFPVNQPPMMVFSEVRHAGGAIARVDASHTAYGNRDAQHILQIVGVTPTPEAGAAFEAYTDRMKEALGSALTGGVYMNFIEGEESRRRSRDGFTAENYSRLQAIKAQYDPQDTFCHSFDLQK